MESTSKQRERGPIQTKRSEEERPKEIYQHNNELAKVNERLTESLARISLPKCHPDIFSGDVTIFHPWRRSFEGMIQDCCLSPEQQMNYLNMYTKGEPQGLVNSFRKRQCGDAKKLLKELWDELERRFGNVATITNVLLGRLKEAARFEESERKKLQGFSDLCTDVASQMTQLPGLACLNYANVIQPILNSLPSSIRLKWEKEVVDYALKHENGYPNFNAFASLIKKQSLLKNHANVTSRRFPRTDRERTDGKKKPYFEKLNTYMGNVEKPEDHGDDVKHCPFHDITGHNLSDCKAFGRKNLQERTDWMKQAGLCFRCSTRNHMAKECKAEVECAKCKSNRHQTILHRDKKKSEDGEEFNSKRTNMAHNIGGPSCSKIVLVDVIDPLNRHTTARVYAVIDEQSNVSMISPELVNHFGISGEKEKYYLSTCSASREMKYGRRVPGLVVRSMKGSEYRLPKLVECENIPRDKREIPSPEQVRLFDHLKSISNEIPPLDPDAKIQLLIGRDAPELMKVRAFRNGPKGAPWAHQLALGWTVNGKICINREGGPVHIQAKRTVVQDPSPLKNNTQLFHPIPTNASPTKVREIDHSVLKLCPNLFIVKEALNERESSTDNVFRTTERDNEPTMSVEDRRFNEIMEEGIHKNEKGNWEMPLPIRSVYNQLPNNRNQAVSRLQNLLRSLNKKPEMAEHYFEFMRELFEKGHAVPVTSTQKEKETDQVLKNRNIWYLPHFGVYHPQKPNKIRVVFDSSSEFKGTSLNKELLSGPDSMNSLLGILIRFRKEPVAIACDIEQMFHCFYVNPEHRDMLRFLWFDNNDPTKPIIDYQMTVHLFGNTSSPAVATYGLRKTAQEGEEKFGSGAKEFVYTDFYVDDGLTSRSTVDDATNLIKNTQQMLATANLRLHKIASNSVKVMEALSREDRADNLRSLDLQRDPLPTQRTLGVTWDLMKDCFTFQITLPEKPFTRRGVLSVVNSIYDPLGYAIPVTLPGRLLLRELTNASHQQGIHGQAPGWDDLLPENLRKRWQNWQDSLKDLCNIYIPRCYTPSYFAELNRIEVHAFSDASFLAIGAVVYLKLVDRLGNVNVRLIFAQAKLAPKQITTIPRLELCAAVLATQAVKWIVRELKLSLNRIVYYTDSKVILGYIQNEGRRFYVYVANRVQIIHASSNPTQWRYVETSLNPADLATRGITASQLTSSIWLNGPEFLRDDRFEDNMIQHQFPLSEEDPEIRTLATTCTPDDDPIRSLGADRFNRFSSWSSLRRALANLILMIKRFKEKRSNSRSLPKRLTAEELKNVELLMIRTVQIENFPNEMKLLQKEDSHSDDICTAKNGMKKSCLYRLDPFVDNKGTLRVGGRLRQANQMYEEQHPAILPKGSHLADLAIITHHESVYHQGRLITSGAIRQAGLWIIGASRMITRILGRCITCKKFRGKTMTQHMANLPPDRSETPPPFTNVGFDVFGPWLVRTRKLRGGAANAKRWGLVFTCLNSRAIHAEVLETMETNSFLCALRRFFALRGPPSLLRCDQGTNFVGAKIELDKALQEMDKDAIARYVTTQNCEWLFNPPHASHFGGVWERQIGTIRRILDVMLAKLGPSQLTHELLVTLMAEVSGIVNSRPISALLSDPDQPQPLTPNMLLTMKTRPLLSAPGVFTEDQYSRKFYRRSQYLADQFWLRWKNEYLQLLQSRSKWYEKTPNLQVGDIVLLKESSHRNDWPMARVTEAIKSNDGKVRKARVVIWRDGQKRYYFRPINQLVFLMHAAYYV